MPIIGHLGANGYHFDINPMMDTEQVKYYIKIFKIKGNEIENIKMPEDYELHCYFEPALKLACLIACQHCEQFVD